MDDLGKGDIEQQKFTTMRQTATTLYQEAGSVTVFYRGGRLPLSLTFIAPPSSNCYCSNSIPHSPMLVSFVFLGPSLYFTNVCLDPPPLCMKLGEHLKSINQSSFHLKPGYVARASMIVCAFWIFNEVKLQLGPVVYPHRFEGSQL
jgi:hypothetical protein